MEEICSEKGLNTVNSYLFPGTKPYETFQINNAAAKRTKDCVLIFIFDNNKKGLPDFRVNLHPTMKISFI